jgi:hypothetical protein
MPHDPKELLEIYSREVEMDTTIDVTNVLDKQFSAPNTKHKWIFRLIKSKKELHRLIDQKDQYVNSVMNKDNPLKLSKAAVASNIDSREEYRQLKEKIKEQELLVEYLDYVVNKIFSQIGFDFKNLVDLIKMEQL